MRVEEDAVGIEPAPRGDEVVRPRIAVAELLARQEVELAPVDSRVELAEQPVDVPQVRPVVGARACRRRR